MICRINGSMRKLAYLFCPSCCYPLGRLTSSFGHSQKMGYWLGLLGPNISKLDPMEDMMRKQWVRLWNLNAPPKLRVFLW